MDVYTAAKSISIKEVYKTYVGKLVEGERGNVSCPFHKDEHPSMHLYTNDNHFYCFSCKEHGTSIDLILKLKGYADPKDAAEDICKTFNIPYEEEIDDEAVQLYHTNCLIQLTKLFNFYAQKLGYKYFADRGISAEMIEKYQLGFCPALAKIKVDAPNNFYQECKQMGVLNKEGIIKLQNRWIFPLKDKNNHIVGFCGRKDDNTLEMSEEPKYLIVMCEPNVAKGTLMFNFETAKKYPNIIMVEGMFDALNLIQRGIPNVVSLLGSTLTKEQFELCQDRRIILALDNDKAGQNAMLHIIKSYPECKFRVYNKYNPKYKDFGEMIGDTEQIDFLKDSIGGPQYLIEFYKKNTEMLENLDFQEKIWIELATLIGAKEPEYRALYPLNTAYTPVAFNHYWNEFYKILKKGGE